MPIRLGDISFGVGAEDSALDRSMLKMVKFSGAVQKAANTTGKGARKIESDFRRQERAILSSLQAILRFRKEARTVGAAGGKGATTAQGKALRSSTVAFRQLTDEMVKGRISALSFDRAMGRFNATMGNSQRVLKQFRTTQRNASIETKFFGVSIRDFASASVIALGPLSGLGAQIQAVASIAARTSFVIAGLIATVTLAGVAIAKLGGSALSTAKEMDAINARIEATAGTVAGAAVEFENIRKLADDTGLVFKDLVNSYARLNSAAAGTTLEGAGVAQILEDISFAAAKFRLPAEDVAGILKAIEQIMSKGTVTAEELRQQLGDRLVGAFNRAADAMGVTTIELNKMLKAGELLAVDFLPKFAREVRRAFGAASITRIDSLQASINRLSNAAFFFDVAFDRATGTSIVYRAALDSLATVINKLAKNMDVLIGLTSAVTFGFLGLISPGIIKGLSSVLGFFKKIGGLLIGVAGAATGIGLALKVGFRFLLGAGAGFALFASGATSAAESQLKLIDSIDAFVVAQTVAKRTALDTVQSLKRDINITIESTRKGIERLKRDLDDLQPRPARGIVLGDQPQLEVAVPRAQGDLRRQQEIRGEITQLVGVQVGLQESLVKITKQEKIELEKIEVIEAARAKARIALLNDVSKTISRIRQQAAAIREGVAASSILARNFKDIDKLARIRTDILKADAGLDESDPAAFKAKMDEASAAILDFNQAATSAALGGTVKTISKMNAMAVAATKGTGAAARLNRELSDTAAAEEYGIKQAVLSGELAIGEFAANRYAIALANLRKAQDRTVLAELDDQIKSLNEQAEAMRKSKGAVEALNAEFARTNQIKVFTQSLLAATSDVSIIKTKLFEFKASLDNLADAKTEVVFRDITTAVQGLRAEAEALASGTRAFEQFKQEVKDNKFIDEWRQKLEAADATTEEITAALAPLIQAMGLLRDVTEQVAVDTILDKVAVKLDTLRARFKALSKGKAFGEIFDDVQRVNDAIAIWEKSLIDAGAEAKAVATALEPLREIMLKIAVLSRSQKGKAKDPLGELAEVEQTIKRIRLEIAAIQAGPAAIDALQRQFDIEDQLQSTIKSLDDEGVAADVAAEKVLKLRNALIALGTADQESQRNQILEDVNLDLDRLAATVATMETGNVKGLENLQKIFDREDDIKAFRESLDPLIFTWEEINAKTEEYIRLIDKVDELGPAFQRQVEMLEAIDRAINTLGRGLEDIFIQIAKDGEFSLLTLAQLASTVVEQILREFFRLLVIKPLLDSIFGAGSSGGGGGGIFSKILGLAGPLIGAFAGGAGGPTSGLGFAGATGTGFQPGSFGGLAHGGSFIVGGRGGTDANFVPLRLTRGERVDVTPAGQSSRGGGNTYYIDASGADPASITRLERILFEVAGPGKIEQRAVNGIVRAQRRNPSLLGRGTT